MRTRSRWNGKRVPAVNVLVKTHAAPVSEFRREVTRCGYCHEFNIFINTSRILRKSREFGIIYCVSGALRTSPRSTGTFPPFGAIVTVVAVIPEASRCPRELPFRRKKKGAAAVASSTLSGESRREEKKLSRTTTYLSKKKKNIYIYIYRKDNDNLLYAQNRKHSM